MVELPKLCLIQLKTKQKLYCGILSVVELGHVVLYSIVPWKGFQKPLLLNYYYPDFFSSYYIFIVCVCEAGVGLR